MKTGPVDSLIQAMRAVTLVPMEDQLRRGVRACAGRQHGVFTRRQALVEYTPDEIRARLEGRRWCRVLRGVYAGHPGPPSSASRVAAARLSCGPDVVACLHTAAALQGFGIVDDGLLHLARPAGCSVRAGPGVRVHGLVLDPLDVAAVEHLPATTAARTAADLARVLPRLDAIAVLDAALAVGATERESIAAALGRSAGLRGVRAARTLLAMADPGAESPMESRLRLRILDAGLPHPVTQYPVGRYRLDLAWPGWRVAAEYDGAVHDARNVTRLDRARHNGLRALGWQVFVFTDRDVYRQPEVIGAVLAPALGRQSAGGAASPRGVDIPTPTHLGRAYRPS
jgi:very-short-patch-repair endonuclease